MKTLDQIASAQKNSPSIHIAIDNLVQTLEREISSALNNDYEYCSLVVESLYETFQTFVPSCSMGRFIKELEKLLDESSYNYHYAQVESYYCIQISLKSFCYKP